MPFSGWIYQTTPCAQKRASCSTAAHESYGRQLFTSRAGNQFPNLRPGRYPGTVRVGTTSGVSGLFVENYFDINFAEQSITHVHHCFHTNQNRHLKKIRESELADQIIIDPNF